MDTVNNTQTTTKQISKQDVIRQIKATMKKVDPTARVILHNCGFHYVSDDIDKMIDLVVVLDKDNDKISWDDRSNVSLPLIDVEEQYDYQYSIYPMILARNEWINNNMPTPFYNTVMNHENGTLLC